jgi:phosphate transport system protein
VLAFGGGEQLGTEGQTTEESGAKNYAGKNLANDFGLAHFDKQPTEKLGKANQQQKNEKNGSQISVRHVSPQRLTMRGGAEVLPAKRPGGRPLLIPLSQLPDYNRTGAYSTPMPTSKSAADSRKKVTLISPAEDELTRLTLKACLITRDTLFNVRELLSKPSRMAFLTVRDCEKELDQIERYIDENLPAAITQVNEHKARQLLACLKFITDLERIGDLVLGVAQRVQARSEAMARADADELAAMAGVVHDMIEQIHRGFKTLDVDCARTVMRTDAEVDSICQALFTRHLAGSNMKTKLVNFDVLQMTQAFERAGDHAKNLAEELVSLIEGHTARHPPKRVPNA